MGRKQSGTDAQRRTGEHKRREKYERNGKFSRSGVQRKAPDVAPVDTETFVPRQVGKRKKNANKAPPQADDNV